MDAGIDKIILTTRDFSIRDLSILGVNRNIPQGRREEDLPVLAISNGHNLVNVRANGMYYNHPTCTFNMSFNRNGAQVIFNPSKILHHYDLVTDLSDVRKLTERIENQMRQVGIGVNLLDATVSRLDLAKQKVLQRRLATYRPALEYIKGKRTSSTMYESGYRWSNKQHEAIIYDKSLEANLDIKNLIRLEAKFKTTQTVCKRTEIRKHSDLLSADTEYITSIYDKYVLKQLFNKDNVTTQHALDFDNEVERMRHLKQTSGRNGIYVYFMHTSIDAFIERFGDITRFYDVMKEAGYSRSYIAKIRVLVTQTMNASEKTRDLHIQQLLHELQNHYAA